MNQRERKVKETRINYDVRSNYKFLGRAIKGQYCRSSEEIGFAFLVLVSSSDEGRRNLNRYFVCVVLMVRTHTHTEIAAMPVQLGTNKWLDLIRQAARNRK